MIGAPAQQSAAHVAATTPAPPANRLASRRTDVIDLLVCGLRSCLSRRTRSIRRRSAWADRRPSRTSRRRNSRPLADGGALGIRCTRGRRGRRPSAWSFALDARTQGMSRETGVPARSSSATWWRHHTAPSSTVIATAARIAAEIVQPSSASLPSAASKPGSMPLRPSISPRKCDDWSRMPCAPFSAVTVAVTRTRWADPPWRLITDLRPMPKQVACEADRSLFRCRHARRLSTQAWKGHGDGVGATARGHGARAVLHVAIPVEGCAPYELHHQRRSDRVMPESTCAISAVV